MPRNLESDKQTLEGMPTLTREPDSDDGFNTLTGEGKAAFANKVMQDTENSTKRDELHPYVQTLNLNDIESCVLLENECFPPHEAASTEKFIYRLTVCNELSLGLFTSASPGAPPRRASTASAAKVVESSAPDRKEILLGHIVSTKTTNDVIKDDDMALPPRWQEDRHADPHLGHKEEGRTLALHSLAVLPEYQRQGLGKTILRSYIQRMDSGGVADRIALLAHDELVPFYEECGFTNKGKSEAQYGGGGWNDMVLELKGTDVYYKDYKDEKESKSKLFKPYKPETKHEDKCKGKMRAREYDGDDSGEGPSQLSRSQRLKCARADA